MYLCVRYASKGLRITRLSMSFHKRDDDFYTSSSTDDNSCITEFPIGENNPEHYQLYYEKDLEHILFLPLSELLSNSQALNDLSSSCSLDFNSIPKSIGQPLSPQENTSMNLTAVIQQLEEQLLPILPMLFALHSNNPNLIGISLEHLFHFISSFVLNYNGFHTPKLQIILEALFEGVLQVFNPDSKDSISFNLSNLFLQIINMYESIPQSCMILITRFLIALQNILYFMEKGQKKNFWDQIQIIINNIYSLVLQRAKSTPFSTFVDPNLEGSLKELAFHVESPAFLREENLFSEIIEVCSLMSSDLNQQNWLLLFLSAIVQLRSGQVRKEGRLDA